MSKPSDAVRAARERDFSKGVDWTLLEFRQAISTPSLRGAARRAMLLGMVVVVSMIAPFAALLAPIGNTDYGAHVESDGFAGTGLLVIALLCFAAGSIAQVWLLSHWWRAGRHHDSMWVASSAVALGSSVFGLWWFAQFLSRASYLLLLPVLLVTGLIGAVLLYSQRTMTVKSEGGLLRAKGEARAAELRALPAEEQQALLAERRQIVDVLVERELVDEAMAQRVLEMPLGEWWTLREESSTG